MIEELFVDGGCASANPSKIAGTWAWCHVTACERVAFQAGYCTPASIGMATVSNNFTELLAAVLGLESVPDGWDGHLYTDSLVTMNRIRLLPGGVWNRATFKNIPDRLVERLRAVQKRVGHYVVSLLCGHPTKAHLACGIGKRGYPVSRHNVFVDQQCGIVARAVKDGVISPERLVTL